MSLRITVKPNESTRIGRSIITVVSDYTSLLLIDGEAPVLRTEHAIEAHAAHTVLQKLHYVLQEMYLSEDMDLYHTEYFSLTSQLINEWPEASVWVCETNQLLISGDLYEAVKSVSRLALLEEKKEVSMSDAFSAWSAY